MNTTKQITILNKIGAAIIKLNKVKTDIESLERQKAQLILSESLGVQVRILEGIQNQSYN